MKRLRYPGRFKKAGRFIEVHIPDVGPRGVVTQGADLKEARMMACDALSFGLECMFGYGGTYPEMPLELPRKSGETWEWVYPSLQVELAWRLRRLREARGWTQQEAARHMGVNDSTYSRWENPRTFNPTVKTLERLAKTFGEPLIAVTADHPQRAGRRPHMRDLQERPA